MRNPPLFWADVGREEEEWLRGDACEAGFVGVKVVAVWWSCSGALLVVAMCVYVCVCVYVCENGEETGGE